MRPATVTSESYGRTRAGTSTDSDVTGGAPWQASTAGDRGYVTVTVTRTVTGP